MKNAHVLSTLFVGIDVSSRTNAVRAIDFDQNTLLHFHVPNNQPGATEIVDKLRCFLIGRNEFRSVVIAMESTSFYGTHLATFLSSSVELMPFKPYVYCVNPKLIAKYKETFVDIGKTDDIDSFVIADFARVGKITSEPWRGAQYLALQRLTRHRLHIANSIAREKLYMLSNMFLKFSELAVLKDDDAPFSDKFGATSIAILTEFLSTDDILALSVEELVAFICEKSKKRFIDPVHTANLIRQAAQNSYRLDKCLYEPLTVSIASSFNCISAFEREKKTIEKAIEKAVKGLNSNEYQCLLSIPGIGSVYAAGILAEIGSITVFDSHDALAKYAGLHWRANQSGDFTAEDTSLSKAGNRYLRYYLIQAANSVKSHAPEFSDFYSKKFAEVKTHQHKRSLALTSRKLVRLIFGLLGKNQLYSKSVGCRIS